MSRFPNVHVGFLRFLEGLIKGFIQGFFRVPFRVSFRVLCSVSCRGFLLGFFKALRFLWLAPRVFRVSLGMHKRIRLSFSDSLGFHSGFL